MWIASCTKLVTCIAAMQCCERGLLSLDDPIYDVLPELKDLPVLKGFNDDGSPKLVPHKVTMTLRHLLTHSSGFAYDETHPKLLAWHAWHRTRPQFNRNSVEAQHGYPLVFEPGESWCYGAGIDWAGVAVERACGGTTLQRYFDENIFSRVGARDVVFSSYMHTRPDLQARMADMSKRDPENPRKVKRSNAKLQYNARGGCFGGSGMFASPADYLKVLQGLLKSDTDGTLLKKESVDEFFRPCLSPKAKAELNKLLRVKEVRDGMGIIPESVEKNWALGGIINEGDVPGGRAAGTMTWGGLPNLVWVSLAHSFSYRGSSGDVANIAPCSGVIARPAYVLCTQGSSSRRRIPRQLSCVQSSKGASMSCTRLHHRSSRKTHLVPKTAPRASEIAQKSPPHDLRQPLSFDLRIVKVYASCRNLCMPGPTQLQLRSSGPPF